MTGTITVLAASSLTGTFNQLGQMFQTAHPGTTVTFSFAGSDTPLGEESESYRLRITGTGFVREAALDAPAYLYTAAARVEDGVGGPILISIAQAGTFAQSRPATLSLG